MTKPVDRILSKLSGAVHAGSGWSALCPAHADENPSLSVSEGTDGRALVKCHRGCSTDAIVGALGLKLSDLFPTNGSGKSKIEATYDYRDVDGNLLYQAVRMQPKDFRQRRPDGKGGWEWKLGDVKRVLYRLPELLSANPDEPVLIVEGEKDAERLAALGLVATCNAGGAGKWKPEYAEYLRGRDVAILPDNDDPGKKHAEQVADSLKGVASRIRITSIPNVSEKGDISDWLGQYRDGDMVRRLIVRRSHNKQTDGTSAPVNPVSIIPASELIRQYPKLKEPVIDGLLRTGEVMNTIAPPKVGKSWLSNALALSVANGMKWLGHSVTQGRVLLIDNELHPETLSFRLSKVAEAMGISTDGVDVMSLRGKAMSYVDLERHLMPIKRDYYVMVIVDSHYRMLGGVSENSNDEITSVYNLIDRYADMLNAAWNGIHHSSKGDQSGKDVTDVGSGAGSMSRAVDCHAVLRRHEQADCYVLEAAPRSFVPVKPLVLRWDFPLWVPDESLNPKQLETAQTKKSKREDAGKRKSLIDALEDHSLTANVLAGKVGIGRLRCVRLLETMTGEGLVTSSSATVRGNETLVYSLTRNT